MRRKILVIAAAAVTLAMGAVAQRGPGDGFGGPGFGPMIGLRGPMAAALDLTEQQKQQAKSIFDAARANAQPIHDQLKQNREALEQAITQGNTATIDSLAAQQGTLAGQTAAIHAKASASFYQLLTPEQREKLAKAREEMKNRMEERSENRGQRRSQGQQQ